MRQEARQSLTKGLRVELAAHRVDSRLARLALLQLGIEAVLEVEDVQSRRRRARHLLHPELAAICELARRNNRIQNIVRSRLGFLRCVERSKLAGACGW